MIDQPESPTTATTPETVAPRLSAFYSALTETGPPHNVETQWLDFGDLSLPSGTVMVGDWLGYPRVFKPVDLPAGEYKLFVRAMSTTYFGLVTRVRLAPRLVGMPGGVINSVEVDSGRLGFFDSKIGHDLMMAVPAGYGEGTFEVREVLDGPRRVGIEVSFEGSF